MRETVIKKHQHQQIIFKELLKPKYPRKNLCDQVNFSNNKIFSVELCPNISLDGDKLEKLPAAFYSVTWHSPDIILKEISNIPAISLSKQLSLHGYHVLTHLVGRHLNKSQVKNILDELQQLHVRNVLALQGEASLEINDKSDFPYACDLVKYIRSNYGNFFCIGGAAYAQAHPDSKNKLKDLKYLKIKVDMGIDFLITQMLFTAETFINFYKECREFGVNIPIIPGIYIIHSYESLISLVKFCKVEIPPEIMKVLVANKKNPEAIRNYGLFQCSQLVKELFLIKNNAVLGVHFFSLNNIDLVINVCKILGLCDQYIERPL